MFLISALVVLGGCSYFNFFFVGRNPTLAMNARVLYFLFNVFTSFVYNIYISFYKVVVKRIEYLVKNKRARSCVNFRVFSSSTFSLLLLLFVYVFPDQRVEPIIVSLKSRRKINGNN